MGRLGAITILVAVIAGLAWGANDLINRITASWAEQDAVQRADLAVASANASLARRWRGPAAELRAVLVDIARNQQVQAVAACSDAPRPLATSEQYPTMLTCDRARSLVTDQSRGRVARVDSLPVSVIVVEGDTGAVGHIVVVHDMRLAELRAAEVRSLILGAFAVFGIASLVFAFFSRRLLRQSWTREIRLVLGGFSTGTEFRGLLEDLRSLAARVTASDASADDRPWTPARLQSLVHDTLGSARIVVLANREPLIHEREADGAVHVMRPASGLVSAIEPIVRACGGTWVAHGSGSADRQFVDGSDRFQVPPASEPYTLRRVWLTEEQEAGYYYGFANEGLWPLCHMAHHRPVFRAEDFEQYRIVNRRFADAVCDEVDSADPIVLVQDYHFALAPRILRERLPAATIVAFWHIPWPNSERLGICPWRAELIHGMLGATIIGFHTQLHCNNFIDSADAYIEARIDRERNAIVRGGVESFVRPYPISVEPLHWTENALAAPECRRAMLARYGLGSRALIGLGVDRLDYTKGIEERLLSVERLLELHPGLRGRFTFVQISAPSRTRIAKYRELADAVVRHAERINQRFGGAEYRPIILLREHHDQESIALHYRAADVCYVSSLHDGMNLVAKEFVMSRADERGVLVLSRFTGASRELTEAMIVNPYDIDGAAGALARALAMSAPEQQERMRAMRAQVRDSNVFRWAGRLLSDAARERRRSHLAERLAGVPDLQLAE